MPTWFHVLMSGLIVACVVAIGVAVRVGRRVKAKSRRLLSEMKRDHALAQAECMIRDGAIECPGAAVIADGKLIVKSVFAKTREFPLSDISVRREGPGLGRFGWFGKRVFHLDTPATRNFAIGVADPAPWRKAFSKTLAPEPGARPSAQGATRGDT